MKAVLLFFLLMMFCSKGMAQSMDCQPGTSKMEIEGENFRALLLNQADMFWDPNFQRAAFQWPKTNGSIINGKHLLFSNALWMGGIDSTNGSFLLTLQRYRLNSRSYWPGPILNNPADSLNASVCNFWNRHFKVDRPSLDSFALAVQNHPLPLPTHLIPHQIREWPGKGNPFLFAQAQNISPKTAQSLLQELAPFVDVNNNGIYEPAQGDYPDLGQRKSMVWCVMNDAGNTKWFYSDFPSASSIPC